MTPAPSNPPPNAADSSRGLPQDEDEGNSATAAPTSKPDDKNEAPPANDPGARRERAHPASGGSIASQTGAPSERFPVSNRVDKRVPEIDWDYAVIERLNTR